MDITFRLPAEHINRLRAHALEGSPVKKVLSMAIGPDHGGEAVLHTIVCDAAAAEALQRLASRCWTPALSLINEALDRSQSSAMPRPSRQSPRRR